MPLPVFDGDDPGTGRPWLAAALGALWLAVFAVGGAADARFALAPEGPALPGALAFFAWHTGALHLGVSLTWLALAGPVLEGRFGSAGFAGLAALAIAAGAALTLRLDPGAPSLLVGPSAGLAALLGAAALPSPRTRGGLGRALPAAFPCAWLAGAIALRLTDSATPPTAGTALPAQLALFAGGAAFAAGVHATGFEERRRRRRARAARQRAVAQWLARADAEAERGHPDAAFALLQEGLAKRPDPRLVDALLASSSDCGRRGDALAAAARAVSESWRAGRRQLSAALWTPLVRAEPDVALDMRLRLALAPMLAAAGLERESALTLRGELRGKHRSVGPGAALRIADAARSLHLPTAIEAARLALEHDALDDAKRARIEALVEALENDPRALAAIELDPVPDGEAAPSSAPEAGDDPEDPRALVLPETDENLELDAAGEVDGTDPSPPAAESGDR